MPQGHQPAGQRAAIIPMADASLIRQDRSTRLRRVVRRVLVAIGSTVLVIVGLFIALMLVIGYIDHRTAAAALDPDNYRVAVPDLIKLCQTDPALLRRKYGEVDANQVPSIAKLNPEMGIISVEKDRADVAWGGGFYHAGWRLERSRDDHDDNAAMHTWTLTFWDEGNHRGYTLQTFTMPTNARFTAADLR